MSTFFITFVFISYISFSSSAPISSISPICHLQDQFSFDEFMRCSFSTALNEATNCMIVLPSCVSSQPPQMPEKQHCTRFEFPETHGALLCEAVVDAYTVSDSETKCHSYTTVCDSIDVPLPFCDTNEIDLSVLDVSEEGTSCTVTQFLTDGGDSTPCIATRVACVGVPLTVERQPIMETDVSIVIEDEKPMCEEKMEEFTLNEQMVCTFDVMVDEKTNCSTIGFWCVSSNPPTIPETPFCQQFSMPTTNSLVICSAVIRAASADLSSNCHTYNTTCTPLETPLPMCSGSTNMTSELNIGIGEIVEVEQSVLMMENEEECIEEVMHRHASMMDSGLHVVGEAKVGEEDVQMDGAEVVKVTEIPRNIPKC